MSDFGNDEYQTMVCVETTNALSDRQATIRNSFDDN
jgi:D-hexose-6-phosphate mutarotase